MEALQSTATIGCVPVLLENPWDTTCFDDDDGQHFHDTCFDQMPFWL